MKKLILTFAVLLGIAFSSMGAWVKLSKTPAEKGSEIEAVINYLTKTTNYKKKEEFKPLMTEEGYKQAEGYKDFERLKKRGFKKITRYKKRKGERENVIRISIKYEYKDGKMDADYYLIKKDGKWLITLSPVYSLK